MSRDLIRNIIVAVIAGVIVVVIYLIGVHQHDVQTQKNQATEQQEQAKAKQQATQSVYPPTAPAKPTPPTPPAQVPTSQTTSPTPSHVPQTGSADQLLPSLLIAGMVGLWRYSQERWRLAKTRA